MSLVLGAAAYVVTEHASPDVTAEPSPPSTTAAYVRDVGEVLTVDGHVVELSAVLVGASTLVVEAPIEALEQYDLVPALAAGKVSSKVSVEGRMGTFSCASLTISGTSDPVTVAPGPASTPDAEDSASTPVEAAASSTHLRCTVPADVTTYAGVAVELKVTLTTTKGARRTLSLPGTVIVDVAPSTVVHDRFEARATIDPVLLYAIAPAISAGTARAEGAVTDGDRPFDCTGVTIVATEALTGDAAVPGDEAGSGVSAGVAPPSTGDSPPESVIGCALPPELEVYPGVAVSLKVTTSEAIGALVVPLQAVRMVDTTHGIVTVVTGTDANGEPLTSNRGVELGIDDGLVVQVLSGITEGDEVLDPITQE